MFFKNKILNEIKDDAEVLKNRLFFYSLKMSDRKGAEVLKHLSTRRGEEADRIVILKHDEITNHISFCFRGLEDFIFHTDVQELSVFVTAGGEFGYGKYDGLTIFGIQGAQRWETRVSDGLVSKCSKEAKLMQRHLKDEFGFPVAEW